MTDSGRTEPVDVDPTRDPGALLAAHAFGATDAAEAAAVRALAARDEAAAAELAAYAALAEALLFAAPAVAPPPALATRLRVLAETTPATREAPLRPGWQVRLARWFAPATWPAWGVAAAALALLVLSNLWWGVALQRMRSQEAIAAAVAADKAAMMGLMTSDTLQKTMLPAADPGTDPGTDPGAAWAALYWDPAQPVALLMAEDLPPLGAEQTYQLWLLQGEERISGGLFTVDARGRASVMVHSEQPLAMYEAIGITREPMGGSPGPTSPPIVAGAL